MSEQLKPRKKQLTAQFNISLPEETKERIVELKQTHAIHDHIRTLIINAVDKLSKRCG